MHARQRRTFAIAALAGALAVSPARSAETQAWRPVETMALAIDKASPPSTVTIERSGDARRRLRVVVTRPSGERLTEMFGEGLVPAADGVATDLLATNGLRSDYVFDAPALDQLPGRRVLLFFGGPDPPTMHLMIVGATTLETYGGGVFFVMKVVRGGGRVELIGRRAPSELVGPRCQSTYAPYAVLVFVGGKDSTLRYSPARSRAYNRAHYVWVGPGASTDVLVDACGARPRLVREPAS